MENANRKITGHMNDPDAPTSGGVQLPGQSSSYFGYLSDGDDKVYTEREWKALHQPPKLGLSSPPAGGGLGAGTTTPLGGWTGTATPDYTITPGQPISEQVLNNYLNRVIRVTNLSQMWYDDIPGCDGPEYGTAANGYITATEPDGYNPSSSVYDAAVPDLTTCLYNPDFDHGRILQSLVQLGAKFVWDMVFLWGGVNGASPQYNENFTVAGQINTPIPWYLKWVCQTLRHDIDYIHYYDPEVICGAGIAEWVGGVGGFSVPANIATLFSLVSYDSVDGTSTGRIFSSKFIFNT